VQTKAGNRLNCCQTQLFKWLGVGGVTRGVGGVAGC